jgi:glycosyltransferase involved in cell wall biosynthesis
MSPKSSELVSVITTTLNEVNRIHKLARNIYKQTYRPLELIVVDGQSTDGTIQKIKVLQKELGDKSFSVRLFMELEFGDRRSSGNARNIGCRVARGRTIILMDADMAFEERGAITEIHRKLKHTPFTKVKTKIVVDTDLEKFLAKQHARFHYCAYRRALLDKVQFDPSLGYGEDQDFWFRLRREFGMDMSEITNVTIARHLPHTKKEFLRQSCWYAETMPQFIAAVMTKKEYGLLRGLCDWFRFWSYCLLPVLPFITPLVTYVRESRQLDAKLSLLLWNSVIRRYISLSCFLASVRKTKMLRPTTQCILICAQALSASNRFDDSTITAGTLVSSPHFREFLSKERPQCNQRVLGSQKTERDHSKP